MGIFPGEYLGTILEQGTREGTGISQLSGYADGGSNRLSIDGCAGSGTTGRSMASGADGAGAGS